MRAQSLTTGRAVGVLWGNFPVAVFAVVEFEADNVKRSVPTFDLCEALSGSASCRILLEMRNSYNPTLPTSEPFAATSCLSIELSVFRSIASRAATVESSFRATAAASAASETRVRATRGPAVSYSPPSVLATIRACHYVPA